MKHILLVLGISLMMAAVPAGWGQLPDAGGRAMVWAEERGAAGTDAAEMAEAAEKASAVEKTEAAEETGAAEKAGTGAAEKAKAAAATADSVTISAPSAVLMEASTGQVIYEKNPDEQRSPASITKIMTLILIF